MLEFQLNPALTIERLPHDDPEICVHVVDDFLANPGALLDYAGSKAYFSPPGSDRTAYPGIRDRLPGGYEQVLEQIAKRIYGTQQLRVHRCMLSLTTLAPEQLGPAQKMPHVDAFGDDQFATVHYLCDESHGGTAIYRYLPRQLVRIRHHQRQVMEEMLLTVRENPQAHLGYLAGNTEFYRQELVIKARFNRLILYPSNLLHCALLVSPEDYCDDPSTGRLSVASFFQVDVSAALTGNQSLAAPRARN